MSDTQLILHVKGTEQTTSLPKQIVRAGIKQGQISYSQLIWSPIHEAWKQVRELPQLWPSQKIAPAPPPRHVAPQTRVPTPRVAAPAVLPAQGKPRPVPTVKVSAPPRVAVLGEAQAKTAPRAHAVPVPRVAPVAGAPAAANPVVRSVDAPARVAKWLLIAVGLLILTVIAANAILVDRPLAFRLQSTPFGKISVFAHLGAMVQTHAIVIHVPASSDLNASNFAPFLVVLASSTPSPPFGHDFFHRVSLTPGWTGRYSFSGAAWQDLGKMGNDGPDEQKAFILGQIDNASGQPLTSPEASPQALGQAWTDLVRQFSQR